MENEIDLAYVDLEYYLGKIVGEYIVAVHLPTLSTDMLKSRNVIQVSNEDTKEYIRLEALWQNIQHRGAIKSLAWDAHLENMYQTGGKYLPHTLKMQIPKFGLHLIKDIKLFKSGLYTTLYDSDICSYSLKHDDMLVEYTDEFAWCDNITLKLSDKYKK